MTAGAALLGFLAGEMLLTDPAVVARFGELSHTIINIAGAIGAALVVIVGTACSGARNAPAPRGRAEQNERAAGPRAIMVWRRE